MFGLIGILFGLVVCGSVVDCCCHGYIVEWWRAKAEHLFVLDCIDIVEFLTNGCTDFGFIRIVKQILYGGRGLGHGPTCCAHIVSKIDM